MIAGAAAISYIWTSVPEAIRASRGPPTWRVPRPFCKRICPMPFNERSKHITQGIERSPNRAMYYALGYDKADFDKPMIGIANGHSTITPCNAGLQPLADAAAAAI